MKIIAINGSPRKTWNSARLLESWKQGVLSVLPDTEIKDVNLYSLDKFTGCTSCFACKRKESKTLGTCAPKDGIHDLLAEIREADAVGISMPIYEFDINAYTKCMLERMIFSVYPYSNYSLAPKRVSFTMLYSMNATEEMFKNYGIEAKCGMMEGFINKMYYMPVHHVHAFNTYQFTDYSKYESSIFSEPDKKKWQEEHFPQDLEAAFKEGVKVANEIKESAANPTEVDHTIQF